MELKEGMYVRTKYNDFCNMVAIRKIEEIDEEDNKFWIDDYIIDTYGDDQNKLCKEDISKASYNIKDLINPGDILKYIFDNKECISRVNGESKMLLVTTNFEVSLGLVDIKSIVTKEQFESMEYKVNE